MTKDEDFSNTLDLCKKGGFSAFLEQQPFAIVFKVTNWCSDKCAHCCECSGPDQPKIFIPEDVILDYIDQAIEDPHFSKNIILTGGEVMSAYKFVDEYYVPNIINYVLDNDLFLNVNTNAFWVNAPFSERIFTDIKNIMLRHRPKVITSQNINTHYPFEMSLSLDRFHENCLERNFKVIERLSKKKISGATYALRISSFDFDSHMLDELFEKLRKAGVTVQEGTLVDRKGNKVKDNRVFLINGYLVLEYYNDAILHDGGRANGMPNAWHNPAPQFTFVCGYDFDTLVAFDSFGNVTLGAAEGEKITVPWRDNNGNARPLADIRADLVVATKKAETEYITTAEKQMESEKTRQGFWARCGLKKLCK